MWLGQNKRKLKLEKTIGFFRLMRPANILTAVADVLAGIAISGLFSIFIFNNSILSVLLLSLSTIGLYGGGVVFNDVFDHELDKVERPERPLPSGLISVSAASALGVCLLLAGISAAYAVNITCGIIAFAISIAALVYNKWSKHNSFFGPVNMGLCRGLNLLLGISIIPEVMWNVWFVAFIPLLYIASITMISRGEVHGSKPTPLYMGALLYMIVIGMVVYSSFMNNTLWITLLFLIPFIWMIFTPLLKAIKEPTGPNIGKSVKAGVIALILLDAAWAATSGAFIIAVIILILLPLSFGLSKMFAVT